MGRICLIAGLFFGGAAPVVAESPDFETQVVPVLTRAGCNSGSCHGAAIGRGGFRLSLLGYDPSADYESLIHEFQGRRVNLVRPEKSLLLRKPTRQLPHEGGHKLAAEGAGYRLLLDWIKAGAPREPLRRLVALDIVPTQKLLTESAARFSLKVTARFDDKTSEDVTRWALLTPADAASLKVNDAGEVTALRRGRHTLMVRFLGEVGAVSVTVPLNSEPPKNVTWARHNFIDDHINTTLQELRLTPSPQAEDDIFLRRVFLDLIGTLPEPKKAAAFRADAKADKRARLIDHLLDRQEFVDQWAYKWGDLLRIESHRLQPQGAAAFHHWVRDQVRKNTPLDKVARDLLLATGDSFTNGPANFQRVPRDAQHQAEFVSAVFLGVRLQCANCHNHPLDRWTQDDYHGLAAVFARLGRGRVVEVLPRGEVIHPRTGKAALPRIPGGEVLAGDDDPREKIAAWFTTADNPFFARAAVNRLWREVMGRGLVEPVDDHRVTNPPTHPALLDALAGDFIKYGYDVKHTLRLIVNSAAYQRSPLSIVGNKSDDRFYARALVRPLPPQVLVDAVAKVTGVPDKLGDLPPGTRAITLGDAKVKSEPLDLLGRCSRINDCVDGASGGGLSLALHTMHGPWLNAKISHPKGCLHQRLKESTGDIVRAFYQSALSRQPTAKEIAHWLDRLGSLQADERTRALEDFLWGLLNSTEFRSNH